MRQATRYGAQRAHLHLLKPDVSSTAFELFEENRTPLGVLVKKEDEVEVEVEEDEDDDDDDDDNDEAARASK